LKIDNWKLGIEHLEIYKNFMIFVRKNGNLEKKFESSEKNWKFGKKIGNLKEEKFEKKNWKFGLKKITKFEKIWIFVKKFKNNFEKIWKF